MKINMAKLDGTTDRQTDRQRRQVNGGLFALARLWLPSAAQNNNLLMAQTPLLHVWVCVHMSNAYT